MEMILNMTQHKLSKEQIDAGVVDLPFDFDREKLKKLLTFDYLPTPGQLVGRAQDLVDLILDQPIINFGYNAEKVTHVMIGGAPFFMSTLENVLKQNGFIPVYAFSVRECHEEGGVKTSVFHHLGFVGMPEKPKKPTPTLPTDEYGNVVDEEIEI